MVLFKKYFLVLVLATNCLFISLPSLALKSDKEQATKLSSDAADFNDVSQEYILTGNVKITKGSMLVQGDKAVIVVDPEGYQKISVIGNSKELAQFTQQLDGPKIEFIYGEGELIIYEAKTDMLLISGQAYTLRKNLSTWKDKLVAEKIEYDLYTEKYIALSLLKVPSENPSIKKESLGAPPPKPVKSVMSSKNQVSVELKNTPYNSHLVQSSNLSSLIATGLQKTYGKRMVVKDVALEVKTGEIVGLLGPNGAGKTTSFYMIVGLIPADKGRITLDNQLISGLPIHERSKMGLSYLPQEASIFRKLSVSENIKAVLELQITSSGQRLTRSAINARLNELLDELQISHLRNNPALSLSGGERRRVEIARALATNPKFILLDEPFAGVDPIAVGEIQRIIRFLTERNIGVLITDHNVRETLGICDHAYIINDGTVLAQGLPSEIIENDSVRRVYLGENFRM